MAPIKEPLRHGIERAVWMLVGEGLGEAWNDSVPSVSFRFDLGLE